MTAVRKIIHIDCDCFYAAIEMRDNPALRQLPLAVGGKPDARGVIATCNYAARQFGVHSAMSSGRALSLCPQLLIVPPDMPRYRLASQQIMAIYRDFTELIEPLSLDEAYLDVTGLPHCQGSATRMASAIRARIQAEVGITASAGIAPNKFLAKVASDWHKPNGQKVIQPEEIAAFVAQLPVKKIPGVGTVTAQRMHEMGIKCCADLQPYTLAALIQAFGRFGERLFFLAQGIDPRPVMVNRERKSLSVEVTFKQDLSGLAPCMQTLPDLFARLQQRWQRAGSPTVRGLVCKVKFADFSQTTVEQSAHAAELLPYQTLLQQACTRSALPVRLIGLGLRLSPAPADGLAQLSLFD